MIFRESFGLPEKNACSKLTLTFQTKGDDTMKKILKIGTLEARAGEKVHGFYSVAGTDLTIPVTLINGSG